MLVLKFKTLLRLTILNLLSIPPGQTKPAVNKPKVKGRAMAPVPVPLKTFKTPESAIGEGVLHLDFQNFTNCPEVTQVYDETNDETNYFVTNAIAPAFFTNGSADLEKKVIVIKDGKSLFSDSWDLETYTVLKMDKANVEETVYFIIKAFISEAGSTDPVQKTILINRTKSVIHWTIWQEPLIPSTVGVRRQVSKAANKVGFPSIPSFRKGPIVPPPQGRGFQKGRAITNGTNTNSTAQASSAESKEVTERPEDVDKAGKSTIAQEKSAEDLTDLTLSSESKEHRVDNGCLNRACDDNIDRDDDGSPDYAGEHDKNFDYQRARAQRLRWVNTTKPSFQQEITSTAEVYAHVQWYRPEQYKEDTEIEFNKTYGVVNKFKGFSYGPCKAQTIRPEILKLARTTQDIVDFYVILFREYCKPETAAAFNDLFLQGLVAIGADHSVSLVETAPILQKKELSIAEMDDMQRLFMLVAYSQTYVSLINFPTEPIDPHYTQISSRVFLVVNTVLHIKDLIMKHCQQHFKVVISNLLMKLKPMMKEIICEYLDIRAHDIGVRQTLRSIYLYSSVAMVILLEHMANTIKNPEKYKGMDAHVSYKKYHLEVRKGHLKKIKEYRQNQDLYRQCTIRRD